MHRLCCSVHLNDTIQLVGTVKHPKYTEHPCVCVVKGL